MRRNIGAIDSIVRFSLGLGLLSLIFVLETPARFFGVIGIVPLATAAVAWCPIYRLFGINTCKAKA